MGHTMIGVSGVWEPIDDSDLWAVRHFLVFEASRSPIDSDSRMEEVLSFIEGWDWQGPGVWLGVDLEGFIERAPAMRVALVNVIIRAKRRIESYGDEIPMDYLTQNLARPEVSYSAGYPTKVLSDALTAILRLLNREKAAQPGATDNPEDAK